MQKSTFDQEKKYWQDGFQFVIGTDEAGRGPLAGPVVAAMAIVKNSDFISDRMTENIKEWDLVRDSKTLSSKQREKAYDFIQENFHVGIGLSNHGTIDEINILEASFLAMKKALTELYLKINQDLSVNDSKFRIQDSKYIILVDGNKKIPHLSLFQEAVIGGDKLVKSISAASIMAKVVRDRWMMEAHEKYPQYGFDKHKGYGTRAHIEALQKFGPCKIHRQSFEPMPTLAKKKQQC